MTSITVPISFKQEGYIKSLIKYGFARTKASVLRRILDKFSEDEAINAVYESQKEARKGNLLSGDLRELVKTIK